MAVVDVNEKPGVLQLRPHPPRTTTRATITTAEIGGYLTLQGEMTGDGAEAVVEREREKERERSLFGEDMGLGGYSFDLKALREWMITL